MTTRILLMVCTIIGIANAADEPVVPQSLELAQQANLLKFLKNHEAPQRYVPSGARFVDAPPPKADEEIQATRAKPIRQYTVQITPHRLVPGSDSIGKADVTFYRPNPDKGKPGITVKHTVDLATGAQIGETEVLTAAHTPISRDELAESVASAKTDSPKLRALYAGRDAKTVTWEYLQMKINRKSPNLDPGDRVLRLVFTATTSEGDPSPTPVRVIVNLTKGLVFADDR